MDFHAHTDSQLVILLQAEHEAALEELMRRYKHPLVNFCYRLLGNAADAEEIAQETFVRVYQNRAAIRAEAKFSTWLFALARNAAIDRLRWRKRHPAELLDESMDQPAGTDAVLEAERHELEKAIAAAVSELPEEQRTAIALAEYQGLSTAEVAGIMKCSEKSVESRLYRARAALRDRLKRWLN